MVGLNREIIEYYRQIAIEASKLGSKVLLQYWGNLQNIQEKGGAGSGDLVTEADRLSEETIIRYLQDSCPKHSILGEESGLLAVDGAEFNWAIDPLDGTTNYSHQLPFAAVSISLLYRGNPIVGVVNNPFIGELFSAGLNCGAFLNDQPIRVSMVDSLGKSMLATGFAYDRRSTWDNNYAEFCYLMHLSQGVRRIGSASLDLAYVACGRFDGYWERGLKIWDIAAGVLLVREAGGVVSSYENGPLDLLSGRILATNGHIHRTMSKALQNTYEALMPIQILN